MTFQTGASVYALAIDPSTPATLYAGSFEGLLKSTSRGDGWSNTGVTDLGVGALAIDPSGTVYVGTSGGVLKCTNAGQSCTDTGLIASSVSALAIDPLTPDTLYAASGIDLDLTTTTRRRCLQEQRRRGELGGDQHRPDEPLRQRPGHRSLRRRPPSTPARLDGVFKSTNGGESWTAINTGLTGLDVNALAIDPSAPATLYAGAGSTGVFKSTDGGESWTGDQHRPDRRLNVCPRLVIDPSAPATLYALTNGGVFKSVDAGASWTDFLVGYVLLWSSILLRRTPSTPRARRLEEHQWRRELGPRKHRP